jgi:protein TonB
VALRRRWEGTTILRVEVLPTGTVGGVAVKQSSGHGVLDDAAVEAVRAWHFSTARDSGGTPTPCAVDLPVVFLLKS